jgi:hypothetical protein
MYMSELQMFLAFFWWNRQNIDIRYIERIEEYSYEEEY